MEKELDIENSRGQKLDGVLIKPDGGDSNSLIIQCHGFTGDRTGSKDLDKTLTEKGLSFYRFSFRGSGDSDGEFNEVTISSEISDLRTVLNHFKKDYNNFGIIAHSLGGTVAILGYNKDIDAMVLASPSTDPSKTMINYLSEFKDKFESGETAKLKGFKGEVHEVGPEMWFECNYMGVMENLEKIDCPVRIIHGSKDKSVPSKLSKKAYNKLKCEKDLKIIEGAGHTYNKPNHREKLMKLTAGWFEKWMK